MNALLRDAGWLSQTTAALQQPSCTLLSNLDAPLWEQIVGKVRPPVKTAYAVSRYFDAHPFLLDRVQKDLIPQKIKLFTQNGITTLTSRWLDHRLILNGEADIFLCTYRDGDFSQSLHGKALIIDMSDDYLLAFGSANFTSAALLTTAVTGNVELVMTFDHVDKSLCDPDRICDPNATAVLLKRATDLVTAPREETDIALSAHEITLVRRHSLTSEYTCEPTSHPLSVLSA